MQGNKGIEKMFSPVGIPVAYRKFFPYKDKPVPDPPYLIYIISHENARGADYRNLVIQRTVTVELYTDAKDTALEQKVEDILGTVEWTKYEDYIDSEKLYMVSYAFDIFEKIRR